jgi:hypothetical protein
MHDAFASEGGQMSRCDHATPLIVRPHLPCRRIISLPEPLVPGLTRTSRAK